MSGQEMPRVDTALLQNGQLIKTFSHNGHSVNMKWDNELGMPYLQFSNLPQAPVISSIFQTSKSNGEQQCSVVDWQFATSNAGSSEDKLYLTPNNMNDEIFHIKNVNDAWFVKDMTIRIDNQLAWHLSFSIVVKFKTDQNGCIQRYPYIAMAGFTASY